MTASPAPPASSSAAPRTLAAWQARWLQLAPRERRMVTLAAAVVALALLWLVLLAPALRTWRTAPAERAALDDQLTRMRALQTEAQALQKRPRPGSDETQRLLTALSTQWLGENSLALQGTQATATLRNVSPSKLAEWLQQVRTQARALPQQGRLDLSPTGWNGTIVLRLPA